MSCPVSNVQQYFSCGRSIGDSYISASLKQRIQVSCSTKTWTITTNILLLIPPCLSHKTWKMTQSGLYHARKQSSPDMTDPPPLATCLSSQKIGKILKVIFKILNINYIKAIKKYSHFGAVVVLGDWGTPTLSIII